MAHAASARRPPQKALVHLLPAGLRYDPELIGEMLQRIVGAIDPVSDFQDLRACRELVADTERALCETYRCMLVMPMTVWREAYFDDLPDGLLRADPDIRCFRLTATVAVLRRAFSAGPPRGARMTGAWPTCRAGCT